MVLTRMVDGNRVALTSGQEAATQAEWQSNEPRLPTETDIRAEGARRLEAVAAAYRPQERETWPEQVREAEAWIADNSADTPLLDAMTAASGETMAELTGRIMTNRAAFKAAAGAILGAQRAIIASPPATIADLATDPRWP